MPSTDENVVLEPETLIDSNEVQFSKVSPWPVMAVTESGIEMVVSAVQSVKA